ncbi:hypothetical protein G4V62_01895 [Bacillaceae bacterium SIJ1]|nr:hypothetical protein [Litoribacterium kuwaitense]
MSSMFLRFSLELLLADHLHNCAYCLRSILPPCNLQT